MSQVSSFPHGPEEATLLHLSVVPEMPDAGEAFCWDPDRPRELQIRERFIDYFQGIVDTPPPFERGRDERELRIALAQFIPAEKSKSLPNDQLMRVSEAQTILLRDSGPRSNTRRKKLTSGRKTDEDLEDNEIVAPMKDMTWLGKAACKGLPGDRMMIEAFTPKVIGDTTVPEFVEMKTAICQTCPVREDCKKYAYEKQAGTTNMTIHIYGGLLFGLSRAQRRSLTTHKLETFIADDLPEDCL